MKISLYTDDLREAAVDLLGVGTFSDEPDRGLAFSHLNRALDGLLEQACRDEDFRGTAGQTLVFSTPGKLKARRILVYGYGERRRYRPEHARRFAGAVARAATKVNAASAGLVLTVLDVPAPEDRVLQLISALAEGLSLGGYRFAQYLTRDVAEQRLKEVKITFAAEDVQGVRGAALRAAIVSGQQIAAGVLAARDLVNEPANALTPDALANRAKKMAKDAGLELKVLGPRELEKQGMGLFLGVAKGSDEEPRLVHLTYSPDKPTMGAPVIALVGKGLTFDSGGLSLKDADSMYGMKNDMGGAAAVYGAMMAIAELKPPCVVHGILAAAENMPDGRAIRPGDVLKSRRGLTVEVANTDAEGRLVLADALSYALELSPTDVLDVATLTGSSMVALGRTMGAVFVHDPAMAKLLKRAWRRAGERLWRLPLDLEQRELLKSDIADLKNLGDKYGGAITAALFLREFVVDRVPRWAHLDIAGPVTSTTEGGYLAKGGTGFGVRTLVEYVRLRSLDPNARGSSGA